MHKCNITLVAIYLAVLNATTVATSGKGLIGFGNVIGFVKPVYADVGEFHDYYLLILGAIKAHNNRLESVHLKPIGYRIWVAS